MVNMAFKFGHFEARFERMKHVARQALPGAAPRGGNPRALHQRRGEISGAELHDECLGLLGVLVASGVNRGSWEIHWKLVGQ